MYTLEDAKNRVFAQIDKGTTCPCCEQFVKLYKRKLNSGMAITLIRVYKANGRAWTNVKDFLRENKYTNSHDWTLLRYWGIMEEEMKEPDDEMKKTNGVWRITEKGQKFIFNKIEVVSHIKIYNGKLKGFEGNLIGIREALGNKFNYAELMEGYAEPTFGQTTLFDKE